MAVGQRPRHRGIDRDVGAAGVDDDKVVAEPVHLAEGDPARVHGAAYMAARRIMSNRHVQLVMSNRQIRPGRALG